MVKRAKRIVNDTDGDLEVYDSNGNLMCVIPPHGHANIVTEKQALNAQEYKGRKTITFYFIKSSIMSDLEAYKLINDMGTYGALSFMKNFLKYDFNILVKKNEATGIEVKITANNLAELMGVTRQTTSRYIRVLKSLNILREIYIEDWGNVLVMNPTVALNGNSVPKYIADLFNKQSEEQ